MRRFIANQTIEFTALLHDRGTLHLMTLLTKLVKSPKFIIDILVAEP
jgi:hypothetical protein